MSNWNVNNWHWEEVNHSDWALDRIKALYKDYKIEKDGMELVLDVESCKGNAFVNVRKGKRIHGYAIKLQLTFKATDTTTFNCVSGDVLFDEMDDFTALEDIAVTLKPKKGEDAELSDRVKKTFTHDYFLEPFKTFLSEFEQK